MSFCSVPVYSNHLPWTRIPAHCLAHLHRGPSAFETRVANSRFQKKIWVIDSGESFSSFMQLCTVLTLGKKPTRLGMARHPTLHLDLNQKVAHGQSV